MQRLYTIVPIDWEHAEALGPFQTAEEASYAGNQRAPKDDPNRFWFVVTGDGLQALHESIVTAMERAP